MNDLYDVVLNAIVLGGLAPAPVREYRFHPDRKWRFDFAWPEHRIALEIEGGVKGIRTGPGGARLGHHNLPAGYLNDMAKYSEAAILGWRILRVQPGDLPVLGADYLYRIFAKGATPHGERTDRGDRDPAQALSRPGRHVDRDHARPDPDRPRPIRPRRAPRARS